MTTNTFDSALARNVGTASVSVYTASSKCVVLQLDITNISIGARQATAWITRGGNDYRLTYQTEVPVGNTLQVVYGQKVVLLNGDILKVSMDAATSADVVVSLLTNAI